MGNLTDLKVFIAEINNETSPQWYQGLSKSTRLTVLGLYNVASRIRVYFSKIRNYRSVPIDSAVLGPLLFPLHINDITADIESEIRLFADDFVCNREIKDKEDTLKLQRDIDRLGNWARKWGMRFQPVKCNMVQLTIKHLNKIQASYTLEGTVLENVDNIKYLGVTITNDLKWNTHISNNCTKANRTLGFLR